MLVPATRTIAGAAIDGRVIDIHTLALTCDDEVVATRLYARPGWRKGTSDTFIQTRREFNGWFLNVGPTLSPSIERYTTAVQSMDATSAGIAAWVQRTRVTGLILPSSPCPDA